jgi:ATP-binding cassette subfamily F protein uup
VTQTIVFEPNGQLIENVGGYQDWIDAKERMLSMRTEPKAVASKESKPAERTKTQRTKLSFNEARELENIPKELALLEQEQAELQQSLADPALYRDSAAKAKAMQARIDEIDAITIAKMERWEALEAK